MNKTAIKNFAIWARNKLIADIVYQAGLLGATEKGIAQPLPQSTGEVQFFDIGTKDYMTVRGKAIRQRNAFVAAIKTKQADTDYASAFRFVVEKVAYTWFNRLIAIRFMEVNDYLPSRVRVLSSENPGKAEPDMVTHPFDTDLSFSAQEQDEIVRMKDENKLDELFRMLFIKQCQKLHEVLPGLFDPQGIERVDSYLELLLTISFTDKDGVLWHLVHDISEDDFNVEKEGQVEIIGWMYQYYNTEPKDQVFANLKKNIKISKDNIPAATQLFTPDWIVRYMVENSLGRLWVEGHPNEELKKNWKYYLEEAEQEPQVQAQLAEIRKEYATLRPEEIKVIDPCMGSGHILVYLFDVLMQIYESQGWTQREAAQSIVQNNLFGLDIDDRAAQLAYFAVMMKARQYDRRLLERGIVPHIYGIQESNDVNREHIKLFGKGMSSLEKNNAVNQLNMMLDVMKDAKEYGSILKVPELDWKLLKRYVSEIDESGQISLVSVGVDETLYAIRAILDQTIAMSQQYRAVITNPPYMNSGGMDEKLSQYASSNYPISKYDLFAMMMERCYAMSHQIGFVGMITMESWMFRPSYEQFRKKIFENDTIINLIHMPYLGKGRNSMEISFGTAAFVGTQTLIDRYNAQFDCIRYYELDEKLIPASFPVMNERFVAMNPRSVLQIDGYPLGYWMSNRFYECFHLGSLKTIGIAKSGMQTGNNNLFLRLWQEVEFGKIGLDIKDEFDCAEKNYKWIPQTKGGDFRKWYGNIDYIVNFLNMGDAIRHYEGTVRIRDVSQYFHSGITWSHTSSKGFGARLLPDGFTFNVESPSFFTETSDLYYSLGLLNSVFAERVFRLLNQTMSYQSVDIERVPVNSDFPQKKEISAVVEQCIEMSRADWDSFENSWSFIRHPLIKKTNTIKDAFNIWSKECKDRFTKLKENEEWLNKAFIDIYSLQGELNPTVNDEDITVHQANLHRDICSFISYFVGCLFGRYSLDSDGLIYAGGCWKKSEYVSFFPDADNCIPITDEAYFDDDIVGRFVEFVRIVYGSDTLEENLAFIAKALGNKGNSSRDVIRSYFLNDFFKDHCSTYSVTGSGKRPIYWLFDSGKQNGFKALVYMHRWNADTVGNLRVEYLHRMQRVYEKEIERMQDIIDNSRDNREVNQASKRREKLMKQLKEARDYDAKIAHIALSRVEIDLDDGVKVNYEKVQKGPDGKSLGILAKI